jgi:hypothetical protein
MIMNEITFPDFIKNRTRETKRWLNWLVFCAMFFIGQVTVFAQFPAPYCNVSEPYGVEEITKVEFESLIIENTNDSDVLLDYTSEVANVTVGESYAITV